MNGGGRRQNPAFSPEHGLRAVQCYAVQPGLTSIRLASIISRHEKQQVKLVTLEVILMFLA